MGIHYDYKSTRGDKAMKKLSAKLELNKEERRSQLIAQNCLKKVKCTI